MIHDNVWNTYNSEDIRNVNSFSRDYIDFLNKGKTERECTDLLVEMAEKHGYKIGRASCRERVCQYV